MPCGMVQPIAAAMLEIMNKDGGAHEAQQTMLAIILANSEGI